MLKNSCNTLFATDNDGVYYFAVGHFLYVLVWKCEKLIFVNNFNSSMVLYKTKKNVRILLVGERGVGKTSLILSLVSEEFPEDVPAKAEEITIPADVTPEKVPTNIVDYSAAEQTDEQLGEEIQRAHVVCIVYAVDDDESQDKIMTKWLPFIRDSVEGGTMKPVMLVCNKVDLVDYSSIETMMSVMENHPEIESCVECSAKCMRNISELFYYAQKSVLYPSQPLYIMSQKELTAGCKKALARIFKICDADADGILNDAEINAFQRKCFNAPLQLQVLEDVKSVIRKNIQNGVAESGITQDGFVFLHKLFFERGRSETTWTVLRKFGYDDELNLSKDYLFPNLKVPSGCSTELSHKGQQFFVALFHRHDRDKDGALSPKEMKDLFSTCPAPAWGEDVHKNVPCSKKRKWMSQRGFLCHWTLITLYDHPRTLEYLGYFGYPAAEHESQITAIHVTREKQLDWAKKQTSRNVYQCHVIGGACAGKSMLCSGLIGEPRVDAEPQCTINIIPVYGQEKFLVLRDVPASDVQPLDLECDVLCLLFDVSNPESFKDVAEIYLTHFKGAKIPILVVGSKADLPPVRQNYELLPEEFCNKHKLPPPSLCSIPFNTHKEIYLKLATMAAFPCFQPAWVMFYRSQARHLQELGILPLDMPPLWWKAGVGLAAATAVGYFLVKALKPDISIR